MNCREEIVRLCNSTAFQKLSAYYGYRGFFDILKISRTEQVHSRFIAWLLNPLESKHGCGFYPIEKFLQAVTLAKDKFSSLNGDAYLPIDYMDGFVSGNFSIRNVDVQTEVDIHVFRNGQNVKRRLDILMHVGMKKGDEEKVLPIILENKVKSHEHTDQTVDYHDWSEMTYRDEEKYWNPICVFLSPDKTCAMKEGRGRTCASPYFIKINYQHLVEYVIEPSLARIPIEEGRSFVRDYLRCLSYSNIYDDQGRREELVMARSREESELLRQFWKSNRPLLSAAMAALAEDDDFSEQERRSFQRAAEATDSRRDYTKYKLAGDNEEYSKRGIVGAVVAAYLARNPEVTWETFRRDFPDTLHTGGFSRLAAGIRDANRYFSPVRLADGNEIVYSNQWGVGNIEGFLAVARELGFEITSC